MSDSHLSPPHAEVSRLLERLGGQRSAGLDQGVASIDRMQSHRSTPAALSSVHEAEFRSILNRGDYAVVSAPEDNAQSPSRASRIGDLFDALPHQLLRIDAQGAIVAGNLAWHRFAAENGLAEADWVDHPYVDSVSELLGESDSERSELEQRLQRVLAGTQAAGAAPGPIELAAAGRMFLREIALLPDGGAMIVHYDRDGLRQLDDQCAQFRAAMEAQEASVFLLDSEGRLDYANASGRKLLGRLKSQQLPGEGPPLGAALPTMLVPKVAFAAADEHGAWREERHLSVADKSTIAVRQVLRSHRNVRRQTAFYSMTVNDLSDKHAREELLQNRNVELQLALSQLKNAQQQLLQSEKMASIGQLAAGVAHEINNPIGYVQSNLGTLQDYVRGLLTLIEASDRALQELPAAVTSELEDLRKRLDLDYITRDLPMLLAESREGVERVRKIVQDLKDFSHAGETEEWKFVDLHRGLDSTLNIVWNDLKYKVELTKHYGELPLVECLPSQLNQVFMNLLVNAGHAISERGRIDISTGFEGDSVFVAITDSGAGIAPEHVARIFDPFFTTKPVGQGTGLGLSLSYGIVHKHGGEITVNSRLGQGTTFRVTLPVKQPARREIAAN